MSEQENKAFVHKSAYVGFHCSKPLLELFDMMVSEGYFLHRSEALRYAMRRLIREFTSSDKEYIERHLTEFRAKQEFEQI